MPVLSVSLDGGTPSMRIVEPRTPKLAPGVLCEVWADERMRLCVVISVEGGTIAVRRLPEIPANSSLGNAKGR
jgi:hypothetical protein